MSRGKECFVKDKNIKALVPGLSPHMGVCRDTSDKLSEKNYTKIDTNQQRQWTTTRSRIDI